ncbi:hypothetical protein GQ600_2777 [Phytophthora cactorum]|nr:hypothetical protein GQ600_2777 [Phytophthora cactorum]
MATIEASASGISGSFSGSPADNTATFTKDFEASKCTSLKEMDTIPLREFTFNGDTTQYMATIDSSTSGFTGNFGQSPTDNTPTLTRVLRPFMTDKMVLVSKDFTKECGYTNPDETPQPVPETYVEWSHGSGEGFTSSHEGPCEVWCDDTRVFKDDNCPKNFPTARPTAVRPRACLGSSRLTIYWIALHSPSWQVYINCAALEKTTSTGAKSKFAVGGSSGGTSTTPTTDSSSSEQTTDASSSTEQTTDAPATPTTDAPTVTEATSTPSSPATEAPSTPSSPATEAPAPTEAPATESPVVTPAANTGASQTSDTSKCSVRRRRRN